MYRDSTIVHIFFDLPSLEKNAKRIKEMIQVSIKSVTSHKIIICLSCWTSLYWLVIMIKIWNNYFYCWYIWLNFSLPFPVPISCLLRYHPLPLPKTSLQVLNKVLIMQNKHSPVSSCYYHLADWHQPAWYGYCPWQGLSGGQWPCQEALHKISCLKRGHDR